MIRISALTFAAALACTSPATAQALEAIPTYGTSSVVGVVPDLALSPVQKRGLREFRRTKSYFGALYVSKDGKAYQHFINFHDLARAKQATKAGCEIVSGGNPCVLAAVSVPKGVDPNSKKAHGLSRFGLHDLKKYRKSQRAGTYGAFALSSSAHQGYSFGWPNEAEARAAAIAFCDASVAQDFAYLGIKGRKYARANGFDKCHVVDTTPAQ